jgi:hypothetical protein
MADFKIENKKLSIEVNGVLFDARKPKFKEVIEMQEKMASLSENEKLMFIVEILEKCGISKAATDELDGDSLLQLLEILNGSKKN